MNPSQTYWKLKAEDAIKCGQSEDDFVDSQSHWYEPAAREAYQICLRETEQKQAASAELSTFKSG